MPNWNSSNPRFPSPIMTISSPATAVDVSALGDAGLKSAAGKGPAELAREFESVFVSMLLKEMRQSLEGGLFPGDSSDTLGGLFDMMMGQHIADSTGGLGLAQSLEKYLSAGLMAN